MSWDTDTHEIDILWGTLFEGVGHMCLGMGDLRTLFPSPVCPPRHLALGICVLGHYILGTSAQGTLYMGVIHTHDTGTYVHVARTTHILHVLSG